MSNIETMPAVEDDPQRRKPNISRAKKYLNWEPRVPLTVGLEKTIEYFRKELERSTHSSRNIFVPKRDRHAKSGEIPNDSENNLPDSVDAKVERTENTNQRT